MSALLVKRQAVADEDYALTTQLKQRQEELEREDGGAMELATVRAQKLLAVDAQDYDLAARLKEREHQLLDLEAQLLRQAFLGATRTTSTVRDLLAELPRPRCCCAVCGGSQRTR